MTECQYEYETYFSKIHIKFACNEPTIPNSQFCFFHDKDHYVEYEKEASKRFKEKVNESISQNKPLECIGYYMPDIDFAELLDGRSFAQPVYFHNAKFYRGASFSEAKFSDIRCFL